MPYDVNEVAKRTLMGISQARKDYGKWSCGKDLNCAPEYIITTSIARAVSSLDNACVTVETIVRDKTVDIVLWENKNKKVIIEVKKTTNRHGRIKGDFYKVCDLLRREKNLQFGLVAYYISDSERMSTERNIKQNINEIKIWGDRLANRNKLEMRSKSLKIQECKDNNDLFWSAATLTVSRRPIRGSS